MRDDYFVLAERIRQRAVTGEEIVQWGMINDETLAKFPRLQRLMARLTNPALGRPGSRLEFYERKTVSSACSRSGIMTRTRSIC